MSIIGAVLAQRLSLARALDIFSAQPVTNPDTNPFESENSMTADTNTIQRGDFGGAAGAFTSSAGTIPPEVTVVRGTVLSAQTRTTFETKQMPAYAVGTRVEPGEIYMEAVDVKEFWLQRADGKEAFIKAEEVSVNARAGHRMAVATVKDVKGEQRVMALANLSTGEFKAEPMALAGVRSSFLKLAFNPTYTTLFAATFLVLYAVILASMGRIGANSMLTALLATSAILVIPLAVTASISAALALKSRAKALAPEMEKLKAAMLQD